MKDDIYYEYVDLGVALSEEDDSDVEPDELLKNKKSCKY